MTTPKHKERNDLIRRLEWEVREENLNHWEHERQPIDDRRPPLTFAVIAGCVGLLLIGAALWRFLG